MAHMTNDNGSDDGFTVPPSKPFYVFEPGVYPTKILDMQHATEASRFNDKKPRVKIVLGLKHPDTGEIVELIRPLGQKYDCPPDLMPVISLPGRPRMGKEGLPNPDNAEQSVPRAFKVTEQRIGTSETCRLSGFTAKQIRKAWTF